MEIFCTETKTTVFPHDTERTMTQQRIWETIKSPLKERLGPSAFDTWFSGLSIKEEGGALVFETPDDFFQNWIQEHYVADIQYLI